MHRMTLLTQKEKSDINKKNKFILQTIHTFITMGKYVIFKTLYNSYYSISLLVYNEFGNHMYFILSIQLQIL